MRGRIAIAVLLALAVGLPCAFGDPLAPRIPADKSSHPRLPDATGIERVVVKFHEGTAVRLRGGRLAAQERGERDRRDLAERGLSPAAVEEDAAEVQRLAAQGIARLFSLDERVLAERRARGEARGGRRLADLDLYYELRLRPGTRAGDVAEFLDDLNALPSVEIAYAQPPARPAALDAAAVPTPSFLDRQGYLNPAPQGIDALYAWTQAGGAGQGVRVVDIEGGWRTTHEDLPALFHAGGTQIDDVYWRNHGTAVLGVLVGKDNGFGVKGIVHQAEAGYESATQPLADALVKASAAVGYGVVLIELHYPGPAISSPCDCNPLDCHYVPAEYFQDHFDAIAEATANGTIVVEAGGNGSTNLDDPIFGGIFQRHVRDSGAILVGAIDPVSRNATCWSNWGSRIDAHGWGYSVTTLGYGDLFSGGGEDRWYTWSFSGTSSASPIVTGAAASLQGRALATLSAPLDPLFVRDLLESTGTPHTGTKDIGSLPDLEAAFAALAANPPPPPPCHALTRAHSGWGADPVASPGSSPGCPAGQYHRGTVISLAASPYPTWFIARWSGTSDDASTAAANSLTMPGGPHTVSVTYMTLADMPLSNNVPRSDSLMSSVQLGTWRYYYVDLDELSTDLVIDLYNLSGDLDLFVGWVDKPTLNTWYCRDYRSGLVAERCVFPAAPQGRWWIGVANEDVGTLSYDIKVSWSPPPPPVLDFHTVEPCRALDSRTGPPLSSGVTQTFAMTGWSCGVPASARAVAVNVTAVGATGAGYVVLWPANLAKPAVGTITFADGRARTNNAILKLATDGTGKLAAQSLVNGGGTVHLIVDVVGYFAE